jgi:ribosome maturation factor RimP
MLVIAEKESAKRLFFVRRTHMYEEHVQETVRKEVEPVVNGIGFSLVELTVSRQKGATRVGVVIHRPSGVGIEECAEVSKLIFPRLETIEGLAEVSLEVSSPGIERVIKSPREYPLFQGRGLRLLAEGETEWIGGVLETADNGVLALRTEGKLREFPMASVRKARLDHKWDPPFGRRPQGEMPQGGTPRGGEGNKEDTDAV